MQERLQHETDVRLHQQQEYEHYLRNVTYERDEAIRTKTLETGELRKMNNILKEHIRDYERGLSSASHLRHDFPNDFSSLDELDVEDNGWEDDFSLIDHDADFPSDAIEQMETTPAPPPSANQAPIQTKQDTPFSWNAFYMCLLFGAFIASNSKTDSKPAVPALSEEYRAESANVLKVLTSGLDEPSALLAPTTAPPQPDRPHARSVAPSTISGLEMASMTTDPHDTLGALHHSLATPSRRQRETAAFSLSAASYDQLTNADSFLSGPDRSDATLEATPSRLQTAFDAMQEGRQEVDKVINRNIHERSVMWERVPEKVLRDFRRMVEDAEMDQ